MLKNDQWSYWERTQFMNEIDFIVIGAGIVGYSTALRLKKLHPNSRVVILERGNLPSGASSKNAGFACFGSASEIYDDIQEFGEEIVWETLAPHSIGRHPHLDLKTGSDVPREKILGKFKESHNRVNKI